MGGRVLKPFLPVLGGPNDVTSGPRASLHEALSQRGSSKMKARASWARLGPQGRAHGCSTGGSGGQSR